VIGYPAALETKRAAPQKGQGSPLVILKASPSTHSFSGIGMSEDAAYRSACMIRNVYKRIEGLKRNVLEPQVNGLLPHSQRR
jgi:hypothetical protein